jgi:hypothetical protein
VSDFNISTHFGHELFPKDSDRRMEISETMLALDDDIPICQKKFRVCLLIKTKHT